MTIRTNRAIGGVVNSTNNAGLGLGANRSPAFQQIEYYLDFNGTETNSSIVGYTNPPGGVALDAAAGNFANGDQYVIMNLPAWTTIQSIQAVPVTSITNVTSVSIGDTSSATLFVNAASTLTAGTVLTQAVTTNPLKFYGTQNTLLLQINGASLSSATGILRIVIVVADMTPNAPSTAQ